MIRTVLIDDHTAFREALALYLTSEPDITVVGQAECFAEATPLLSLAEVAVVDLQLGEESGFELLAEARDANPRLPVLILTVSARRADRARAVALGAAGLLHKSVRADEIVDAIRRLAGGERLFTPSEMHGLLQLGHRTEEEARESDRALQQLTRREREVLETLAEGLSDKLIARKLSVSTETIRCHMARILGKLKVQPRLEAVVYAARNGFVDLK